MAVAQPRGPDRRRAMFLLPFLFVLLTSLMTNRQALTPTSGRRPFVWSNYAEVFERLPSVRYACNTMQIAVLSTVGVVRLEHPGRLRARADAVAGPAGRVRPGALDADAAVPGDDRAAVRVVRALSGWIPSFKPLIVPSFFGDAFSIFLLRQFFMTIPEELSDAARVDGASELQIMTRVIVPLAEAGDRRGRAVQLPLLLERLLRAAAVRWATTRAVDARDRPQRVPRTAPGRVQPDAWRRRCCSCCR